MLLAVAFGLPEIIEKHLRCFHTRILTGFHLRLRPVDAVNLRLTVGKGAEIVVFRRVLQLLNKVVALQIVAHFVVPGTGGLFGENAFNYATAALADEGFLLFGNAASNDVIGMDLRHRVFTARLLSADRVDLA